MFGALLRIFLIKLSGNETNMLIQECIKRGGGKSVQLQNLNQQNLLRYVENVASSGSIWKDAFQQLQYTSTR